MLLEECQSHLENRRIKKGSYISSRMMMKYIGI